MSQTAILYADGDDVRDQIERLLLAGELDQLSRFSKRLGTAIERTAAELARALDGRVLVSGGDDILISFAASDYSRGKIGAGVEVFETESGCKISIGVGLEPVAAFVNLRRSKAEGGGRGTDMEGTWILHD